MASKRYKFHVNTSFCFMCSDKILTDNQTNSDGNSFSLKYIFQYLKIELSKVEALSTKPTELLKKTDVRVSLCDGCQETFKEISKLYTSMEVLKMKLDYNFEIVQKLLKSTLEVQKNHKEEFAEKVSLRHFKLAKELQKEIFDKCNLKMPNHQPRIKLKKVRDFKLRKAADETLLEPKLETPSGSNALTASSDVEFSSNFTFQPNISSETEHDDDIGSELDALETSNEHDMKSEVCKMRSPSTSVLEDSTENSAENKVKDILKSPTFSRNSSTRKYDCPVCNQPYKNMFTVQRHYESVHLRKRFKCDICKYDFTQLPQMKMHKRTCKGPEHNKPSKIRKAPTKLKNIYYTKDSTDKMYHCEKCDKKYQTIYGLKDHYEAAHLKIRYPCDICNISVLITSSSLAQHKKTCLKTFGERLAMRKKRSLVKIICKLCGKEFASQRNLRTHRLFIHENVNGVPCEMCGEKFTRANALKAHKEEVHLGKMFCCRFCNAKFTSYWKMRYHLRKCTLKSRVKMEPAN